MISNEHINMLRILANSLHDKPSDTLPREEWETIKNELFSQSVFAIPSEYINLSENEQFEYSQYVSKNIVVFHKLMYAQQKLFELLKSNGIQAVILKGSSAAMSYPKPELRCMGDIDIIVCPKDFEKAFYCLLNNGYSTQELPDTYKRHVGFETKNHIQIELHHHFSISNNNKQNKKLDDLIYNGIAKRETKTVLGYTFYMLPQLENGIVLLSHINQHLESGLGLRQIIDWMCYVEKYLDDSMWNNEFAAIAETIGMKKLAIITTAMCKKYLGLHKEITWCNNINENICDQLMEYILKHGNFGNKNRNELSTIHIIRWFRNPIKGLIIAQKKGLESWKLLSKYNWLKPFAWFYQIYSWIISGISKGVNLRFVVKRFEIEKSETELLKELGVTRIYH